MNQPLWDELKDAPEDTRILQEMCERNGKSKVPTPNTVRLTVKASEALLGTLPKKEKDPGSPFITTTVGDVVIRNTFLDLGASVNILPGYLYDKYKNEEIEPAEVVLQLADQSTKVSWGKLTNVIVKVGDFFYPVDFLVMEYESLDDAPTLILGRPFLATAGSVIDCKTGDMDIFFGTRKRRLNMFGNPVSLPSEGNGKQVDRRILMEAGIKSKEKIWTRTGEGGKEEMMEARHQQYEKESREREAKVFKLLESQQQWISGVSDRMTQLTSLMSMMANNFVPGFQQMLNYEFDSGFYKQSLAATRLPLGPHRGVMMFRLDHPFLQFPEGLASSAEYVSRRDALTGCRVLEATVIDGDILRDAGLWGAI
ncbi:hypothetical protein L2E82_24701 [Cichorium intybus]|uniref:Uncharacterized protein n=1 Tax=Cichorium intybus TaxID=13427 RepID=A0ACB9E2K3_CICIN|nr:hypothetical protein L2E82_24701 [Cichorium intybus]